MTPEAMRDLIHRLTYRPHAAKAELETLVDVSPEEFFALAKEYYRVATTFADESSGFLMLRVASRCGTLPMLAQWVEDSWDTLSEGGRRSFLYAAADPALTVATDLLHRLIDRDATSEFDRFRIYTGLLGTYVKRNCGDLIVEIGNRLLCELSDPDLLKRLKDLVARFPNRTD